ncbi:MAG: dihydrodipicolinate synthase family protein [Bryobacterales bacterium]|nr:dihydrodipicolinate synthase family protein [Bryobacterales bacterium]
MNSNAHKHDQSKRNPALPAGIVASCVTPFSSDGKLELSKIQPHVNWLIGEGVNGLSPLGSSGEFTALDSGDRQRVLDAVMDANAGRLPVWGGTHHYSTQTTIELSKHAQRTGASALLIVPPYYMSPTASQTMNHYRRIAEAVDLPVIVYHNVTLTNVDMRTHHLLTLFQEGAIAGVKMSNAEPDRICQLLQESGGALRVYCGVDSVAFEGLCHGAHGWISGIPSIVPRAARRMYDAIALRHDLPSAREQWAILSKLMRLQFTAYSTRGDGAHWFSVMKATLNMIGPPVGEPQPPIQPLEPEYYPELRRILTELGYACSS